MLEFYQRYPNLIILSLQEEADIRRLLLLLSGSHDISGDIDLQSEQPRLSMPAKAIANLVLPDNSRSIGAKAVVVELDYIDWDSNIAYALVYARAFRDYSRRTIRLHFFKNELTSYDELLAEEQLKDSYLGFCVLSPSQPGFIGRTVLPPPKDDESWTCIPPESAFSINLGGAQMEAKGTAFVQQDGRVAACASAATWMSVIMLPRQFGFDVEAKSMAEITQLGTKYSFAPAGYGFSPGLSVDQICLALREMGYEVLSYEVYDPDGATELIYTCVESGIPPILVIGLPEQHGWHAVTVCGHTYEPTSDPTNKIAREISSTSIWCPYLLIHDDQIGPYLKITLGSPNTRSSGRPSLIISSTDSLVSRYEEDITNWYRNAFLRCIIMPFPPRHLIGPESAYIKGRAILTEAYSLYSARLGIQMPTPPIFRTYLMPSNAYRRRLIPESAPTAKRVPGLSSELASWYRGSSYPRYIWVIELCGLEHRSCQTPENLRIVADVTIDPTSSPRSLDFVTLHLPHLFYRMARTDTDVHSVLCRPTAFISDDKPYQPLVRLEKCQPSLAT